MSYLETKEHKYHEARSGDQSGDPVSKKAKEFSIIHLNSQGVCGILYTVKEDALTSASPRTF